MAKTLSESIAENLKYFGGVDGLLGKFYYVSDPEDLKQAVERWLVNTPEGRAWLDSLGFVNKGTVVKVIEQVETNLEQANRDLLTKIQMLKSYVSAKGSPTKDPPLVSELR